MQLHSFTVGPFAENTYLLTQGEEALLIDPGFFEEQEYRAFRESLDKTDCRLLAVVLTHAHIDHVMGLHRVMEDFDCEIYLSDKDRYLWNNIASQAQTFGFNNIEGFEFDPAPIPPDSEWTIGSFTFDTIYTPGHAPDHIALYHAGKGLLIAGDTLFKHGIGRTDLYKGSFEVLEKMIRNKIYTLPDETEVYPGHGPKTTVGYEKKNNPFIS